jgi:hypothetical protein
MREHNRKKDEKKRKKINTRPSNHRIIESSNHRITKSSYVLARCRHVQIECALEAELLAALALH